MPKITAALSQLCERSELSRLYASQSVNRFRGWFLSRPYGFSKAKVLWGRASTPEARLSCNNLSRFQSFTAPEAHLRWQESADLPAKSSRIQEYIMAFKVYWLILRIFYIEKINWKFNIIISINPFETINNYAEHDEKFRLNWKT